jgi:sporulation protein YlmC with PRC-barrel domain
MERRLLIVLAALGIFLGTPAWVNAAQESMQSESGAMQTQSSAQQMGTQQQNPLMNMQAKQIQGKPVVNAQGEKLGNVSKIAQNKTDKSIAAVISIGGFLGMGAKKIAVPIDQLQLQENKLVWNKSITKEQLKQQPEFQQAQFSNVDENKTLAEVSGAAPGAQVSFQQLDSDSNGYISKDEAQSDSQLYDNFSKADTNADNQIDQSEFSAFEQSQSPMTPGETETQPQSPQSQ